MGANDYDTLAAQPADGNEYDAALQIQGDQKRQSLRSSVIAVKGVNPDQYGKAKQLGRVTGLPADTVYRNAEQVQQTVDLNAYDELLHTSPITAQHMSNPDFAGVAHDDVGNLAAIENTLNPPPPKPIVNSAEYSKRVYDAKVKNPTLTWDDARKFISDQVTVNDTEPLLGVSRPSGPKADIENTITGLWSSLVTGGETVRQGIRQQFADALGLTDMSDTAKADYNRTQLTQDVTRPKFEGKTGQLLYGGAENVVQNAPVLAAAILTRNPNIAAGLAAIQTEATAYPKYRARGATGGEAALGAGLEGAIEFATEKLPLEFLTENFGKVSLWKLFAGDQVREQIGEQIATHSQDLVDTLVANPTATIKDYLAQRPDAALQTAVAVLMQGVVVATAHQAAISHSGKTSAQLDADHQAQRITQAIALTGQSKVNQRDPQSFEGFVNSVAEDGPVQDIHVDARQFAQSAGPALAEIVQQSPSVAAQLDEAILRGGDIVIPVGEYATKIAPLDEGNTLLPHLRTSPDAMSQDEAKTFMQGQAEEFKREAEKILTERQADTEWKQSAAVVETKLMEQLSAANRFTPDVNSAYAKLMGSFYTVQAARLGITPEQMFAKYPLQIKAESVAGKNVLDQGGLPTTPAEIVDRLRFAINAMNTPRPEDANRPAGYEGAGTVIARGIKAFREGPEIQAFRSARQLDMKEFYQGEGANRGQASFGADITTQPSVITLLQNADLSTFLHENGHFYLEVLNHMASQPDAPQGVRDDMAKVLQWFGVESVEKWNALPLEEKRPFHEQFARGFESYLFEGTAPSQELTGLFSRFRAWMLNVYKSLTALNVKLSDDVRGVFNRMLATNDQILAAEAARSYAPLFKSAEQMGATPEEWKAYQDIGQEATQEAVDQLQTRSLRNMQWLANARGRELKRLQKEATGKRKEVEAEVTAEVAADPVYAAQHWLKRGEMTTQDGEQIKAEKGFRLNTNALKEMYPETMLARPNLDGLRGMTSAEGLHPDMVAEMFGFSSGDELVRKVLDAEPESTVIEGKTDQRMLERYGDVATPEGIERAANEAIHNEARAKFIATELRALSKATGERNVLVKAAKEFAAQIVARKKIRDVKPAQYAAAEARAAKAAETAKGLVEKATEKRNQLVNFYATRAAYEALGDIEKGARYLNRVADSTSIDAGYLEQIHSLLERFDLRKLTNKEAAKRTSLAAWIQSQEEQGLDPVISDEMRNETMRKPYREMTVEEFRGLVDAVKNIEHLGRLKKKLLTVQDQREFDTAVETFVASINDNAKKTVPEQRSSDRGLLVSTKRLFGTFLASHRKFSSQVREMDGWQDDGVGWNYLVRNMNVAGDFEAVQREKATMHLHDLLGPVVDAGKLNTKQFFPLADKSFTREERLAIALNMGNEVNRERVMAGERLTPKALEEILNTLTEADWKFVQGVWDHLESFRPQIAAKELRLTGVEPEWVEASPVLTKFGTTLRGGYYPIKYDALRSDRSYADMQAEIGKQMQQGFYARSQTRRGHLKARAESTGRPLRYDLDVITEHIGQVVHDLAWHEYLIDASRLLRSGAIEAAVREHYGPIMLQSMKKMLTDIAIGETGAQEAGDRIMNHLRYGATIAGLGLNVSNALVNMVGLTQSMSRLGTKWVAKGMIHWAGDAMRMEGSIKQIYEKSDFMRLRGKTLNRELNEIRNKVTGDESKLTAAYFWLQNRTQMVVDVPTWWGGYEKAMAADGMTEERAIALADQAVIDAQGSGQFKDLSGVQRGGAGLKLFTTFYSFFNTTYNATSEAVGRTNFRKPGDVVMLAADMALLYTIPALIGTLVKHLLKGDLDDRKKLMKDMVADQIAYRMGSMVLLRELTPALQAAEGVGNGLGYSGPASTRFFEDVYRLGQQVKQGDLDAAFWKSLNNVAGVLFHYPAGQVNRTAEGLYEMAKGRTQNPGTLLVGPAKH